MEKMLYSIGEVSDLCNISRKTLRYYEELGLITPDAKGRNNYRYYSRETILQIPIIKYYKMMGFTLEEMKSLVSGCDYSTLLNHFHRKVREFEDYEREIYHQKVFITDWYNLISEAQTVIDNCAIDPALKYVERRSLCAMPYVFEGNYAEATINVDFTNFVENIQTKITGPVMMRFPSLETDPQKRIGPTLMIQNYVIDIPADHRYDMEAGMYTCAYHIGDLANVTDTYQRMLDWMAEKQYVPKGFAIERYICDYWTTPQTELHVTEVLMPIVAEKKL